MPRAKSASLPETDYAAMKQKQQHQQEVSTDEAKARKEGSNTSTATATHNNNTTTPSAAAAAAVTAKATRPTRRSANDFRFGKSIGEGSFSTVYLAKDIHTGKECASEYSFVFFNLLGRQRLFQSFTYGMMSGGGE